MIENGGPLIERKYVNRKGTGAPLTRRSFANRKGNGASLILRRLANMEGSGAWLILTRRGIIIVDTVKGVPFAAFTLFFIN